MNIESPVKDGTPVSFELGEDYPELRDAVRRICAEISGRILARPRGPLGISDRVRQ